MNIRFRLFFISIGALVVALTFAFPYWQPLLTGTQVQEVFPGLAADLQPAFQQLSEDMQNQYIELEDDEPQKALALLTAALSPNVVIPQEEQALPVMQGPQVISRSSFTQVSPLQQAEGTATVYLLADNSKVLRFESFRITNGPDLRVFLSAADAPLTQEEFESNGTYLEVGALLGNVGSQNYTLAPQIDLSQYNSIVIYSAELQIVFSSAPLTI